MRAYVRVRVVLCVLMSFLVTLQHESDGPFVITSRTCVISWEHSQWECAGASAITSVTKACVATTEHRCGGR